MMQLISGLITGLDCFIIYCGHSHDFSLHKLTYVGYVNQAGVSIKTHLCPPITRPTKNCAQQKIKLIEMHG